MPTNVANLEFLDSGLSEVTTVEKPFVYFTDVQLSELSGTQITFQILYENTDFLGGLGGVQPKVQNVSPAGGTGIKRDDYLSFDVIIEADDAFRELIVIASFPNLKIMEVVYMDSTLGPQYDQNSTVATLSNGFHFNIVRNSGWPASPTLIVKAVDLQGAENV